VALSVQVAGNVAPAAVAEASVEEPDDFESDEDIDADVPPEEEQYVEEAVYLPRLSGYGVRTKGRRLVKPVEGHTRGSTTPEQKLLILDTWMRSGLPMGDFAGIVGLSKHTLYIWKKRFDEEGPAGLLDRGQRGKKGSRLPEITKRTILMLKKANPTWGCQRISDMLVRGPALPASPEAVARVLHEDGYETVAEPTRPHPDKVRSFERAKPNQLWQTDLFTFTLKRQNRRVNLIAFLDDHSRFIVSYGLYGSSSTALVLEVLNAAIASYGPPEEVLTDNGPQYITWRGKSAFSKELEKRGIKQIVAHPRRPRTLGKVERFWGTLWRECVESSIFLDVEDARKRIGLFIDYYNFQRPHQGVEGLVPADRFFQAAPEVLRTMKERVAANALELARNGVPLNPLYLTGQFEGKSFSVHAEAGRLILRKTDGSREEIDPNSSRAQEVLAEIPQKPTAANLPEPIAPHGPSREDESCNGKDEPPAPGVSPLDEGLQKIAAVAREEGGVA
jgi:transposase InsO family protein